MSSSITKAVFRLLREEEEVEDQYYSQSSSYNAARRHFPRLEAESLAEREFRVAVARQVCGLMRGYQECLFFVSSNQPVFNRDRFLRNAPALFEQRRGSMTGGSGSRATTVLSPRAKRFLSLMVNTQHFHQLLERLDFDDTAFFHEVMDTYDAEENADATSAIGSPEDAIKQLCDTLQKVEDKIPTYRVDRYDDMQRKAFSQISPELVAPWEREGRGGLSSLEETEDDNQNDPMGSSGGVGGSGDNSNVPNFVQQLLLPISVPGVTSPAEPTDKERRGSGDNSDEGSMSSGGGGTVDQSVTAGGGVKSLSVELLIELENNPWRYSGILDGIQKQTPSDEELKAEINEADPAAAAAFKKNLMEKECVTLDDKLERVIYERKRITIKDAIGERRFRVYKLMLQQKALKSEDSSLALGDPNNAQDDNNMDLNSLLTVNQEDEGGLRFGNTEVLDLSGASSGAGKKTPLSEEEEFQNQRDRDVVKRCLERAYEGAAQTRSATQFQRRSSNDAQQAGLNFHENGRDLIQEAEAALRNPSAQRFLVTVLSKRARLENQRRARRTGGGHSLSPSKSFKKGGDRASVSRLVPAAFECLVRLCCAMLEACLENQDYESAYTLLTHTAGFCTVKQESNADGGAGGGGASAALAVADEQKNSNSIAEDGDTQQHQVIYMTARIGMHPIFADLRLWERVLQVHLQDRQQNVNLNSTLASDNNNKPSSSSSSSARPSPSSSLSQPVPVNKNDEYEAAVSTLYEMLAFGVPAEELARFATRVSEARGWFSTEKGQALLVLARRLTMRRDDGSDSENPDGTGSGSVGARDDKDKEHNSLGHDFGGTGLTKRMGAGGIIPDRTQREWEELAWAHPTGSSTPSRAGGRSMSYAGPGSTSAAGGASAAGYSGRAAQLRMKYGHASFMDEGPSDATGPSSSLARPAALGSASDAAKGSSSDGCTVAADGVIEPHGYTGRSAITSLASFGASVVATGGLDGSVFLAHTLRFPEEMMSMMSDKNNNNSTTGNNNIHAGEIRGVRVECGKDNGAVTCLAATKGAGYKQTAGAATSTQSSAIGEDEDFFAALEGCRVVAGTTGGALRVWSVKDIYASTAVLNNSASDNRSASTFGDDVSVDGSLHSGLRSERDTHYVRTGQQSMANKLKWSLKGRALSGHRGGVSCVDVPSPIYRPDSLVSGGADGLIKLWSLRHASRRTARAGSTNAGARGSDFGSSASASASSRVFARGEGGDKRSLANDAQETLSGHKGRVLCVKTAWHGDRLLSGGADKTVRLWDISTATGQPLQTLNGHTCWVTHAQYWGQNNIVSGSTDRSIALWDARSGTVPLFVLRFHKSPISDLLLGSRTDPLMVSSGGDGVIATWDFRKLASSKDAQKQANGGKAKVQTVRTPVATMTHAYDKKLKNGTRCCGAILLARGTGLYERSVVSASIDGYLKEWDVQSGKLHNQQSTNHTEAVSCLTTFAESDGLRRGKTSSKSVSSVGGTITCSWDGTVRVKRLLLKSSAK
jgi:WD40 repeat protein